MLSKFLQLPNTAYIFPNTASRTIMTLKYQHRFRFLPIAAVLFVAICLFPIDESLPVDNSESFWAQKMCEISINVFFPLIIFVSFKKISKLPRWTILFFRGWSTLMWRGGRKSTRRTKKIYWKNDFTTGKDICQTLIIPETQGPIYILRVPNHV